MLLFDVPKFFLPKCKKNVLQVTKNSNTEKKISSQAYARGSDMFRCWGLKRMKSDDRIAGRIKAADNVFRNCFFVIFIDENNLDIHMYAMNDITAQIE